jgi:glycosyltransferase involved in cell wall biosynthesis
MAEGVADSNLSNTPLVSVIINCFNGAQYLSEAIESVLAQTYQNWEIIFWDNHSTDDSSKIFLGYEDPRLNYYLAPNFTNLGLARHLAVEKAKGLWIGFLDCDDLWLPNKLMEQISLINAGLDDVGIVYGQFLVINSSDRFGLASYWEKRLDKFKSKTSLITLPEGDVFKKLLKFNFIPLVTAIFTKEAYESVGGLSTELDQAEDYDLFLKIAAHKKIRAVQKVVALYRVHGLNTSINNEEKGLIESIKIINKYLPTREAIIGLRHQHTAFALTMILDGKTKKGISYLLLKGGIIETIEIIFRKILRRI